jgi:hypothetical protein
MKTFLSGMKKYGQLSPQNRANPNLRSRNYHTT